MNMNNKGFTLIELVVTIALLAVISIISFVSINGVISQNKINNSEILINNIKTAAKDWLTDYRYASDLDLDGNKEIVIESKKLIDRYYLSSEIVSPFDSNNKVDSSKVKIKIYLNDDNTPKKVDIYKNNSNNEANKYICDTDSVEDSKKYDCNKKWWDAVLKK